MNSQVSTPTQQFRTPRSGVSGQKSLLVFAADSPNWSLQREGLTTRSQSV